MAEMNFETALKKLEKIVSEMEKGEVHLDSMLKKFYEGMKLAEFCAKKLEEAEKKIEVLTKKEGGKIVSKKFEPEAEEKEEKKEENAESSGEKEEFLF